MKRSYQAYYYYLYNGELKLSTNTSCWAGVNGRLAGTEIYIEQFREKETEFGIEDLVATINKITPCSLVNVKGKELIKYQLIGVYNKDLLLLNFIRNLWYSLSQGPWYNGANPLETYSEEFFMEIISSSIEDPIEKLTTAHQTAISNFSASDVEKYRSGHSNFYGGSKIRKMNEFAEWDGMSHYPYPHGNEIKYFLCH